MYYAHSENSYNLKHILSDHLHQTENFAKSFACKEDYQAIFKMAGLMHDLGKYQPEFQSYLNNGGRRGSDPHAVWGAGYARSKGFLEMSIAIDGHHKGLPDNSAWKSDTEPFKKDEIANFKAIIKEFIDDTKFNETEIINLTSPKFSIKSQREIFMWIETIICYPKITTIWSRAPCALRGLKLL